MVCNTGVGLAPTVNGEIHHFDARGLYNGLTLLWDRESDSWWNHITGYAVYGPLMGHRLQVSNVLHSTVAQTLDNFPNAVIAISGTAPPTPAPLDRSTRQIGISPQFALQKHHQLRRRPSARYGRRYRCMD